MASYKRLILLTLAKSCTAAAAAAANLAGLAHAGRSRNGRRLRASAVEVADGHMQAAKVLPIGGGVEVASNAVSENVGIQPSTASRDAGPCTCNDCMVVSRIDPTQVSNQKCMPKSSIQTPTGAAGTCEPPEGNIDTTGKGGVPYEIFCTCHCQPLLTNSTAAGNQQENTVFNLAEPVCVDFSSTEVQAASTGGGNCKDLKLGSAEEEMNRARRIGEEAAEAEALDAASQAQAQPENADVEAAAEAAWKDILEARSSVERHHKAVTIANENARLLVNGHHYYMPVPPTGAF